MVKVNGVDVDERTGCAHYRSALDIIAIRFSCCGEYYACYACHEAAAGHPARRWKAEELDERAILCGACGAELTIQEYLGCGSVCPRCGSGFNPNCARHYPLYFELPERQPGEHRQG